MNKSFLLLLVTLTLPILASAQLGDFHKIHTERFDSKKWSSAAAEFHESGYIKYEYKTDANGIETRYEYYDDGSLLSEMIVVRKFSRDTSVTFDPATYQEMIQITAKDEILPNGSYIEYHPADAGEKTVVKLQGQFREGKKTGTWTAISLAGDKTISTSDNTTIDHTAYGSYQTLAKENQPPVSRPAQRRQKITGQFTYQQEKYIYRTEGEYVGIVDEEGTIVVPIAYKNLNTTNTSKGVVILEDEKFHLFDLDTRSILIADIDEIDKNYQTSLYYFTKDGKQGVIDPATRTVVAPAEYNHIQASKTYDGFSNSFLYLFHEDGIDLLFKTRAGEFSYFDQKYQAVTGFRMQRGYYAFVETAKSVKVLSLDSVKTVLEFPDYQDFRVSTARQIFIKRNERWSVYKAPFTTINSEGKFEDFRVSKNGEAHIEVMQDGLWGVLDKQSLEELIVPCLYDSVAYAMSHMYKVFDHQGKVGLVNLTHETLVPLAFEAIHTEYALRDKYWVKENGMYRLFDGEPIGLFDHIVSYFSKDLYVVSNKGKQGVYSHSANKMLIPCAYDKIYRLRYGRDAGWFRLGLALEQGTDIFFADFDGKMLSEEAYESIVKIPSNCEIIAKDYHGKSHVITNCPTSFELPPPADSIRQVEEAAYVIANDGKFGFFSSGNYLDFKLNIAPEYEEILWYLDTPADGSKLLMVKQDNKWLWLDPETGKNRFPYTFDSIDRFYDGRRSDKAPVVLDGQKKYLRLNGELEDRR